MVKKLGVIGGLGPIATAYFYQLISQMTDACLDQEHIEVNIISKPSIPDRTDYILGRSKNSPLPHLIEAGRTLDLLGADYIAIPCITAHYFHEDLSKNIKAPIIHIIKETVKYLNNHGIIRAGIMATEGTIESKLFQKELEDNNIKPILPSKRGQALVTDIIYKYIKAGLPVNIEHFYDIKEELVRNGAETNILGCTELSLIKRDEDIGTGFIDSLEILSMCSIISCGASLKKEYSQLIT